MKTSKWLNTVFIAIILFVFFFICFNKNKLKEYKTDLFYMDTYISVKIYTNKSNYKDILNKIDNIYKEYHKLTDRYNAYDNINNIYYINNNAVSDEYIEIDRKLYDLIKYGYDWYDKSNGLFNINMGNVIDVWKKYRSDKNGIPSIQELNMSGSIDINNVILKENKYIKNNNINLDLGGIAKGYATNEVGKYLNSIGIKNYIINAGGNVLVGEAYKKNYYQIGIESPTEDRKVYKIVKANNVSVVTSGGYERFYEYNGILYHHIIDPKTLYPSNNMKSVTVITKDSALADILSTTLFLMSVEDGQNYVNSLEDVEAVWYTNDNKIITSKGFYKYE